MLICAAGDTGQAHAIVLDDDISFGLIEMITIIQDGFIWQLPT
jgi:hypothetical protein